MFSVEASHIYTMHMSPILNGSSEIQCFEHRDVVGIRNGITEKCSFSTQDCHYSLHSRGQNVAVFIESSNNCTKHMYYC